MKIHSCASNGDCKGVESELSKGVPVDVRDEQDYTPLAHAVSSIDADEKMLRLLIESGADVNAAIDASEKFPIGMAACSGSVSKVQLLLDAGANVNFVSPKGYTVLINVMYSLHDHKMLVPIADLLVKNGAEVNSETEYGESPLSVASRLGRFDAVKFLLEAGADPSPLCWTELMRAVALGSSEDVEQCLNGTSGLDDRDSWGRTPFLLTAFVEDVRKAKLLQSHGANLDDRDRGGITALMYCAARGDAEMLQWLVDSGADIEAGDRMGGNTALMLAAQAGATTCVQLLLQAGAVAKRKNEYGENAIAMASNEETIRLLTKVGEDIGDISTGMKRTLTGLRGGDAINVSKTEYLSGRRPRFGKSNPEVMTIPFWHEMVRAGVSAYQAKSQFGDTDNMEPVWCFSRFGTSFTELPDGRFVQIGGEHEDFYDPDFCIYNDVIVHNRSGTFQIMGYPKDVFAPTDFHSATLVEDVIYIIGGLGYHGSRIFGTTPIYRLNCKSWKIEPVQSFGQKPGWIFEHDAISGNPGVLVVTNGKICQEIDCEEQHIENNDVFRLDLSSMHWTRI